MTDRICVLGVDPGFASLGAAVLMGSADEGMWALEARAICTAKADKKKLRDLRVSADDERRMREIWEALLAVAKGHPEIVAVAVETYSPYGKGKGGGNSWKASLGYALTVALAYHLDVPVFPFVPSDLKKPITGKKTASKTEVATALYSRVRGLREMVEKEGAKTKREHITDAAGHALLGISEMLELRRRMGL